MRRPCYVVDSFAAAPLAGNPAGVVLDGSALDAAGMQRIAGELKHSETAFVLPAREPQSALHLRWFTPAAEVAFCGHATLAALHVLVEEARRIRVPEGAVTRTAFTCKSGRLSAELSRDGERRLRILIETPDCRFEPLQVPSALFAALGVLPELLDPKLPPQKSALQEGNLFLALRTRDALSRCRPDAEALAALGAQLGVAGFVVFTLAPEARVDAALRCFFPACGIPEDPVTGSAAAQLGALLQAALPEVLPRRFVFAQGDELRRPGRVLVEVRPDPQPGRLRAFIGGEAVTVLRGELDL